VDRYPEIKPSYDADGAAEYIASACAGFVSRLSQAIKEGDAATIAHIQARAERLRVHAITEDLHPEIAMAAMELMRRAERALGQMARQDKQVSARKLGLSGKKGMQIFALVDGVDDERFEQALAKARAAGRLSRVQVIMQLRNTVPAAYKSAARKPYARQPLPQAAREAGWKLDKTVRRIEHIVGDKRYPGNKNEVAVQLHSHLTNAIESLTKILARVTPDGDYQ
jgi:hypothetical protein